MTYKAVAFDMDGTILDKNREILPETVEVIKKISAKGIKVLLATGRHHSVVYPYHYQLGLDTPVICCNGSYLYDFNQHKVLAGNPMSKEQAKTLLGLVNKHGIHTLIYTDEKATYEVLDDHLEGLFKWINSLPEEIRPVLHKVDSFIDVIDEANVVYKFATSSHDLPALRAFSHEIETLYPDLSCEWSWSNRADVAKAGNNKGAGLEQWSKLSGVPMSQIVAFGDNYNDITMLKGAGLGIAMGNGEDDIKAIADRVIGDNNSPSIALELEKIFL
ncbi:pyridoxal phosphatase [Zophobihabitans entericus]|uniref:Pyridoxal phosphatase n=1 Tax=Zophobihabitans entericus TaxID=1635327 RepID=A0A6G9IAP3_9GAMM|nr:pyridoxal phosphatase [Zophobihabitans entericus]QIQ21296.1 pyridoxal phosphatase [Zophobihabitans entericus]